MCGSATFAMEVSRTSMKAARATVAAISQGLTSGFHCPLLPAAAVIRFLLRILETVHEHVQIQDVSVMIRDSSWLDIARYTGSLAHLRFPCHERFTLHTLCILRHHV